MILQIAMAGMIYSSSADMTLKLIVQNKPKIDIVYAKNIVTELNKLCKKYKIPSSVVAGIIMAESGYKLNTVNLKTLDYGIMQINYKTIKAYKFDKRRLTSDLRYSLAAGVKVYAYFYKRYGLKEGVMRYNCGTKQSCVKSKSAKNYLKKVLKYSTLNRDVYNARSSL